MYASLGDPYDDKVLAIKTRIAALEARLKAVNAKIDHDARTAEQSMLYDSIMSLRQSLSSLEQQHSIQPPSRLLAPQAVAAGQRTVAQLANAAVVRINTGVPSNAVDVRILELNDANLLATLCLATYNAVSVLGALARQFVPGNVVYCKWQEYGQSIKADAVNQLQILADASQQIRRLYPVAGSRPASAVDALKQADAATRGSVALLERLALCEKRDSTSRTVAVR